MGRQYIKRGDGAMKTAQKIFILITVVLSVVLTSVNFQYFQGANEILKEAKGAYQDSVKNLKISQRLAEEAELRTMQLLFDNADNVFTYIACQNPKLSTREITEIIGSAFAVEDKTGQDAFRTLAIAGIESDFTKTAVSPVGALGINQLMPDVWETYRKRFGFTKEQVFEVYPNMLVSAVYYKEIYTGDHVETAGKYNGGGRWREKAESQQYVKKYLISSRGMDKFRKGGK